MGLLDNLSVGLITYKESEYLNNNFDHEDFTTLVDVLKIPSNRVVISCDDKYTLNNLNINTKKFIKELIYYLYILIHMQLKIVKHSQYKSLSVTFYHVLESIFITSKPLILYILSIFFKKYKYKFLYFILRQKNISEGHIQILKKLYKNNSDYILILEDDMYYTNPNELAKNIISVLKILENSKNLKVINCSESFTEQQLGIKKIRLTMRNLDIPSIKVIQYKYPVINTACAIIYTRDICYDLISELEALKKYSFIPIDHKINISLSKLIKSNKINSYSYASTVPGIFIQGSIHD